MKRCQKAKSYLALDDVALLENLDNDVLVLGATELGLKSALGGSVEGTLVAVAIDAIVSHVKLNLMLPSAGLYETNSGKKQDLLVGDEDLEAVDDLSEGDAPVLLPVLNSLSALSEDNEVVAVALVVDSDLGSVSAHVDVWWRGCVGCCRGGVVVVVLDVSS